MSLFTFVCTVMPSMLPAAHLASTEPSVHSDWMDQAGPPAAPPPPSEWAFAITPYLWATELSGDVGVGSVSADVDVDFDELGAAVAVHAEAMHGQVGFYVDSFYADLDGDGDVGPTPIESKMELLFVDFGVQRRIGPKAEGLRGWAVDSYLGARYYRLEAELDFSGMPDAHEKNDWIDLVVGDRYTTDIGRDFVLLVAADIGGFGLGSSSDLAWNVLGTFGWKLGERGNVLWAGYRFLDVDKESSDLEADVQLDGPTIGFEFRF